MAISASGTYTLTPRYKHKQTGKQLSGFAVDLTLRFNQDGAGFLQDHNFVGHSADGTFPHNDLAELQETLNSELERLYNDHFKK